MEKINIQIYTNLNNLEETCNLLAIKDHDVIKYNDLENNIVIVDMKKNIMTRENNDYQFIMNFNENNKIIKLKEYNKLFDKQIKTLLIEKKNNSYIIRYHLIDEDIINEYHIKF